MAKYTHTTVQSGDTLLADAWNEMGQKVQALNAKLDEETSILSGPLSIDGALKLAKSEMYFTDSSHSHTGLGNEAGHAAVENASDFNTLMIIGRNIGTKSAPDRKITAYDDLTVNRHLYVNQNIAARNDLTVQRNAEVKGFLKVGRFELDNTPSVELKVYDFKIGHSGRRGSTGRALVDNTSELIINYGADWKGGLRVASDLIVNNNTTLGGTATIQGTANLNGGLNITTGSDAFATFKSTNNSWLYSQWQDSGNRRRAWMGLDSNLSTFQLHLENATNLFKVSGGNMEVDGNLTVNGIVSLNRALNLSAPDNIIMSLKSTDNSYLYSYWKDSGNKLRAIVGLDADLSDFLIRTYNETQTLRIYAPSVYIDKVAVMSFKDGSNMNTAPRIQMGSELIPRLDGVKNYTKRIPLSGFKGVPKVHVSIAGLDTNHDRNTRINVQVQSTTQGYFDLLVQCWADTIIYSAKVHWMAADV